METVVDSVPPAKPDESLLARETNRMETIQFNYPTVFFFKSLLARETNRMETARLLPTSTSI